MNLYTIEDVLTNYTSGVVVTAAPTLERCREIFSNEFKGWYGLTKPSNFCIEQFLGEFDSAVSGKKFVTIEEINYPEGVVSYVYGGA